MVDRYLTIRNSNEGIFNRQINDAAVLGYAIISSGCELGLFWAILEWCKDGLNWKPNLKT